MAGESQETTGNAPDPTNKTTEQMLQKVEDSEATIDAKFEAIAQRLNGIDKATELLHDDFTRFPTEVQKEVGHLKELFEIRLKAEQEISAIREAYRIELKADSKEALSTARIAAEKAVQAALAAAEKARDQETIRTQLANDKVEKAFTEALKQQQITFTNAIANIVDSMNETKDRLTGIEQRQFAISEGRNTQRLDAGQVLAFLSLIVAAVAVVFVIVRG